MAAFKFTKTKLNELPCAAHGEQDEYYDSQVKGLRLRVGSGGRKTFYAVRKVRGKFIRVNLGRFPEISVDKARDLALKALGDISETGKNPNTLKREHEDALITLGEAIDLYIATRGDRLKNKTAAQYRRTLKNFSADWMKQPLASISRESALERHREITGGSIWFGSEIQRKGVASGSKAQANLWGRSLRAVYNFAYDHCRDNDGNKLLPEPPTLVLNSKRQWHFLPRKNTRIRNHDLGRWLKAVDAVRKEADYNRDDHIAAACDALDMALFTGLRRDEVFSLEWDRVNIKGGYFWIDKTKNGLTLELPLTDTLVKIIKRRLSLKKKNDRFVFPSARGKKISEPRPAIDKIKEKTATGEYEGYPPINFTCHDARRTFASLAESSGVGSYTLKRLMNHKSGGSSDVTQGYINLPVDELIEPARVIEKKILKEAGILVQDDKIDSFLKSLSDEEKNNLIIKLLR
ncbi:site-specific integrase [Salmonella enterica]|nr:site-specific integrase [Salmonella enterica]